MKFFIAEKNIGQDATKEDVDQLIKMLTEKGWDVEYGLKENIADGSEDFNELQDRFSDDFIECIEKIENQE